jgi:hypothetical protein
MSFDIVGRSVFMSSNQAKEAKKALKTDRMFPLAFRLFFHSYIFRNFFLVGLHLSNPLLQNGCMKLCHEPIQNSVGKYPKTS